MPARRQGMGETDKGGFRAANGGILWRTAIEADAVIGHDNTRHQWSPDSSAESSPPEFSPPESSLKRALR